MMKLTNREKQLVMVLGFVLIGAIYFQFIIKPQSSKLEILETKAVELRDKVNQVNLQISSNNQLNENYKTLHGKTSLLTQKFFNRIQQENHILLINRLLKDSGLSYRVVSYSDQSISEIMKSEGLSNDENYPLNQLVQAYQKSEVKINQEGSREQQIDEKQQNQSPQVELNQQQSNEKAVEKMEANITVEGSYEQILSFIRKVEAQEKKIIIERLTISSGEDEGLIGNISLAFYGIPKLLNTMDNNLHWNTDQTHGKVNPFYEGMSLNNLDNPSKTDDSTITDRNHDFIMTVKPISSDLPTVTLGRAFDNTLESYVYADNQGLEKVDFMIVQKDDKYFFKYRTQRDTYPKDYEENMVEFLPKGKTIVFKVLSKGRNGDADQNGVELTIDNKSDRLLEVKVLGDSASRPRIITANQSGRISIVRSQGE
ncbi:type II secretion system protein GspM [Anaerosolibacter sp.]|uniref:type II secretion system protein GspM n=1 Tax=Anaerosolibacter sp. TaxID=1872527 RepID=UPI0039EE55F8